MASDNETLEDVVAEMRGMGNYQQYSGDHARALADRIEAAVRREKTAIEADALAVGGVVEAARHKSGNMAAMREALTEVRDKLLLWNYTDKGTAKMAVALVDKCDKALAAPPRNCDTPYNDRVEMYGAFKDWCRAKGHTMEPMLAYDAFEWLLATAVEQKGGNNGRK